MQLRIFRLHKIQNVHALCRLVFTTACPKWSKLFFILNNTKPEPLQNFLKLYVSVIQSHTCLDWKQSTNYNFAWHLKVQNIDLSILTIYCSTYKHRFHFLYTYIICQPQTMQFLSWVYNSKYFYHYQMTRQCNVDEYSGMIKAL